MNWINKVTPPGLKTMMSKKDTPDDLWVKCPASGELIYRSDLEQSWYVTPAGAHLRISPRMRFRILLMTSAGSRFRCRRCRWIR